MSVKQLGRRLLQIVIVLIGISFFTFILTYLAPGDPVRTRYAASGMVPTEKELQEERERLGLNDPVLVQYGRWLGKVLHGDFGTFIRTSATNIKVSFFSVNPYVVSSGSAWNVIGSL